MQFSCLDEKAGEHEMRENRSLECSGIKEKGSAIGLLMQKFEFIFVGLTSLGKKKGQMVQGKKVNLLT